MVTCALSLASPARAADPGASVTISAGPLLNALQEFERQTGVELLFDRDVVAGLRANPVKGRLPAEDALRQMLAGAPLQVRRSSSGALIIERAAAPLLAQQDAVVAEILITGRRTQNSDIRRLENDIQPYDITTRAEILGSHRDDVGGYFASRVPSNTQIVPPELARGGETRSEINLRGLGAGDTLVLVDGRRMPAIPIPDIGFYQTDVNAIPLHAIKRIETLTGTAGGIYGFGALGGVVNVVLDRDSRGLDLYVTEGVSSRGDGQRHAIEASYGKTVDGGATDFTAFAAHTETGGVLMGRHPYRARDARIYATLQPLYYIAGAPTATSIGVFGIIGSTLTFKPEYGGATLTSAYTFLPLGFSGSPAQLAAGLAQHAGQLDFSLPAGDANSDLGSNPRSDSLFLNVRHRFGSGVEIYADLIALRSRGQSYDGQSNGEGFLSPDSPANPFEDYIELSFPVPGMGQHFSTQVESARFTTGLVTRLPFGWRGSAEIGLGALRQSATSSYSLSPNSFFIGFGDPADLNPLGNWNAFQTILAAQPLRNLSVFKSQTRFSDLSLRLAGPVFSTREGPATLTLSAERRSEDVLPSSQTMTNDPGGPTETTAIYQVGARSSLTTSFSAELRTRLFGRQAPAPFLRGLELQVAARHDDQKSDFPRVGLADPNDHIQAEFAGTTYTVGAKVSPWPWLTLRGSYATGEQPPALRALSDNQVESTSTTFVAYDPKRGGQSVGDDGPFFYKTDGNPDLKAARADTLSLGVILTPWQPDGPSLTIDYSRIRETGADLILMDEDVVSHEDFWPGRIKRAPLTDEDRAKGYTAGRIIMLDTRDANGAALDVDVVGARVEWPMTLAGGRLRLYAEGSYQVNNLRRALFQPGVQRAGYQDGPLKWRANGGGDWSNERLSVGFNLQYFGSYFIFPSGDPANNDTEVQSQGSAKVPQQIYLDLHLAWRLAAPKADPSRGFTLEFGIINVFDAAPPRESPRAVTNSPAYSRYGDPRQRRFELVLSRHF